MRQRPTARNRTTGAWLSRQAVLLFLVFTLPAVLPAVAKSRGKEAQLQMRFGVDMAQKGAWKEAQYRFERAAHAAPGDGSILNNLAVAYEHNGHYERAEQAYLRALEADPAKEKLRANYERFRLFYTDHLERQDQEDGEGAGEDDDSNGSGNQGEQDE